MTKTFRAAPLHVKLREALIERITSGEFKSGDILPNETELALQYDVSPGTVRRALDWLEEVRILRRRQGKGTFVNDPTNKEFVDRYERLRLADGSPISDEISTVKISEDKASAEELSRLALSPNALVRRTQRVRALNGVPYLVEYSVTPVALFPLAAHEKGVDHRLLELAKMFGVLLGRVDERISSEEASAEIAAILECKTGGPLLKLDRVVYTVGGSPAKWRVSFSHLNGHYYWTAVESH